MNIKVWSDFTKRKNSTKQPTGGTQKTVVLKEECSLENPVFILNEPIADYTYVEAFGEYFFVTDVINLDKHRSEVRCTLDPCATYKTGITGYTAFVERAASSYDAYINDQLLTAKQDIIRESVISTNLSVFGSGCYIAEVLNKNDGIALYVTPDLSPYKQLLTPSCYNASDIQDWIDSKIAQAFDLDVYIGSIKWVPFDASDIGTQTTSFYIGPVDVGVPASYTIRKASQSHNVRSTVSVSLFSQDLFNDFRDCNPRFTQYNLRLPGVGIVDLDSAIIGSAIHHSRSITCDIDIDLVSGDVVYTLNADSVRSHFARFKGNVSVNVPIGKSVSDMTQSISMVAGGVAGGAVSGGVPGAIIGGVVGLVNAVHNELTPQTSMVGGSGNKADLIATRSSLALSRRQYGAKDYPTTVAGRPLYQNVLLSTLSGFVKCGNASVPLNCRDADREAINNYLNTGIYIE